MLVDIYILMTVASELTCDKVLWKNEQKSYSIITYRVEKYVESFYHHFW